jgi:hypothetical protein
MEVSSQLHAPTVLLQRKDPVVPICYRGGWTTANLDAVAEKIFINPAEDWATVAQPVT